MNRPARFFLFSTITCLALFSLLMFASCDSSDDDDDDFLEPKTVAVTYQGNSYDVDLSDLESEEIGGIDAVVLSNVLRAALGGDINLNSLAVDFAASDGFSPEQSPYCLDIIPLEAAMCEYGWIEVNTANLSWDEDLEYPGCMGVRGVAEIFVEDIEGGPTGKIVSVEYGGQAIEEDLLTVDPEDVDGVSAVNLADLVELAFPNLNLEDLLVDFASIDGFMPADSTNCTDIMPLDAANLTQGWLEVDSADMFWDIELAFPGCLHVTQVSRVILSDA